MDKITGTLIRKYDNACGKGEYLDLQVTVSAFPGMGLIQEHFSVGFEAVRTVSAPKLTYETHTF